MSSHHDDVDDFWGGQRDWTDSQPRQRTTGRTPLSRRLKTGVQSVFDAGATASRLHGETGPTPVADPPAPVPDDLDFDLTPAPDPIRRTSDGLSIGELAQPYEAGVHEATQPVPRVNVGVVTPPSNRSVDAGEPEVVADPEPSVTHDYSGLAVETDAWDEDWDTAAPVRTARGGVDPLLAKFGMAVVVLTLLAGFFISTRGGGSDDSISSAETATTLASGLPTADEATGSKKQASGGADSANQNDAAVAGGAAAASTSGESEQVAERAAPVETQAAEVECGAEYEVVEGDYWLRLAEGAGVSLSELLSVNGTSANSPLYPGSTICLPEGAATPPPPPPPSTAAPAPEAESASASASTGGSSNSSSSGSGSTAPAATAPATTAPPATQPPATAPPTTAAPASASEVERLIREIFPADQHEKALAVAWRESNHRPEVYNGWCCYGVFQIYYSVHTSWLPQFGINQASDLYDAGKNIRAAYHLYQQSGWGPWGG